MTFSHYDVIFFKSFFVNLYFIFSITFPNRFKLHKGGYQAIKDYNNQQLALINAEIEEINKELEHLPEGNLLVYPNGNYYRWFYSENNSTRKYLSKSDEPLAVSLAQRKYLTLRRDYLNLKANLLTSLAGDIANLEEEIDAFICNPGYSNLLEKIGDSDMEHKPHMSWEHSEYETNPYYKEQLTYTCPSGNMVRSKSEVFIDMALNKYSIPYRYECKLQLHGKCFYPDFTLLHPLTGEIFYWEHLGKMDDKSYGIKALNKHNYYYEHDIIPGKNLILTFETKEHPFTFLDAENIIKQFFL